MTRSREEIIIAIRRGATNIPAENKQPIWLQHRRAASEQAFDRFLAEQELENETEKE